jgi:hypothetical protein
MATSAPSLKQPISHIDSVPADYFDEEGCAALTRTLSRMSQEPVDAPATVRGRSRALSIPQSIQDTESALGTLVEDSAEEVKFDLADRIRTGLEAMDKEGVKKRDLGVGFVVRLFRAPICSLANSFALELDSPRTRSGGQIPAYYIFGPIAQELAPGF